MSHPQGALGVLVVTLALAAAPAVQADPPASRPSATPAADANAAALRPVIARLAALLEARYLDPAIGRRYAQRLRSQRARGAYDGLADPAAFARQVTADLQAVAPDRHLRLALQSAFAAPQAPTAALAGAKPEAPPLEEARMIGDVAYLRFNRFPQEPETAAAARAFLLAHADARAVILDGRPLRGGGAEVIDALLPLFYAQPTTLVRMDMREIRDGVEDDAPPGPAMVRRSAPEGLRRFDHRITPDPNETRLRATPLYYLTSHRTASAGEHLALALKRTGRGVLIGETTAGAGHFGSVEPLPGGFGVFLPIGRTYDPDTGLDWEGRGVTPDVPTAADAALDEALARIAHGEAPATSPSAPPTQRNPK